MKKINITLLFMFLLTSVFAQEDSLNTVRVMTEEAYTAGHPVSAEGFYAPLTDPAPIALSYSWQVSKCDQDGNAIGDPVYEEVFNGAPSGLYDFPQSETWESDHNYLIRMEVRDIDGRRYEATAKTFLAAAAASCINNAYTAYTLIPGQSVTLNGMSLTLPSGIYYYSLSVSGNTNLLNSFSVAVNGVAVSPNTMFSFNSNTPSLTYSIFAQANKPLCSSVTYTIKFYSYVGYEQCSHSITITTKDGSKQTVTTITGPNEGVYYKGDDGYLYRRFWANNTWNHQAVNIWGGWGAIKIDGWLCGDANTNKVYFKGQDNKLYNVLLYQGVALVGPISSVANLKSDLQRRNDELVYIGTDNKIHRVYFANNTWNYQAIVPSGGWGSVTAAGGLTLANSWSSQNIFFRSPNGTIYNLYMSNNQWYMSTVTASNGTVTANGEMIFDESQARLYYRSTNNRMNNVTYNNGWTFDPMNSVNGYVSVTNTITKYIGDNRIFYKGPDGRAYAIYILNGQWRTDWLNPWYTGILGDMVAWGNNIYFVSQNKNIENYWFYGSAIWAAGALAPNLPANAIGCSTYYRWADLSNESDDLTDELMSVSPNPSSGIFTLTMNVNSEIEVKAEVYNLQGELVDQFSFWGTSYLYAPDQKLSSGMYLLSVYANGEKKVSRLIVE